MDVFSKIVKEQNELSTICLQIIKNRKIKLDNCLEHFKFPINE